MLEVLVSLKKLLLPPSFSFEGIWKLSGPRNEAAADAWMDRVLVDVVANKPIKN